MQLLALVLVSPFERSFQLSAALEASVKCGLCQHLYEASIMCALLQILHEASK